MSNQQLTLDEFPAGSLAEWRAAAEESLKGAPFEKKLVTRTHEGIALQPIYTPENAEATVEQWPGLPAYLRGRTASGPRMQPWLFAQELPCGDPAEFNKVARHGLERGQTALNLLLDAPTKRLLDPDEAGPGEAGHCGLSVFQLGDLDTALAEIDIARVPLVCFAGCSALPVLGALAALAQKRKVAPASIAGAVLADPYAQWALDGTLAMDIDSAIQHLAVCMHWAEDNNSPLRLAGVQGALWGDCGATAVEELAFAIAAGADVLRRLAGAGIEPARAVDRCAFSFSLGSQIFMQIAKLRAARLLWWNVCKAFGAEGRMWIHARGGIFNKSCLDPHTNLLRATAEGFAGAVGGADSMHIAPFDQAIRPPDAFSMRIARNAHVILAEECGFSDLADAGGGSWYVETLTRQVAAAAWQTFQDIEKIGGFATALRDGVPQAACAASADQRMKAAATRRDGYIGVNWFPDPVEPALEPNGADHAAFAAARAGAVKAARTAGGAAAGLDSVESVVAAWQRGATLGQIRSGLPGTAAPPPEIRRAQICRATAAYEELRARARAYAVRHGAAPAVWLANFGPPRQHKMRADFSAGFLTPGGFVIGQGAGAKTPAEAAQAAAKSGALAVVICSTDETYPEIVPPFIEALRAAGSPMRVILAGFPEGHVESLEQAGVQHFLHIRVNCLEFNRQLQQELGIA